MHDLSAFNDISAEPSSNCHHYESCVAIRRLLCSLSYYESLHLRTNQDHQEIFLNFINEVYKFEFLIQDFHHFQKRHDHQIHSIMQHAINTNIKQLKQCDIGLCTFASRHYRVGDTNDDNNMGDSHLNLYCDTLDSFHYYVLQAFDTGFRIPPSQDDKLPIKDDDNKVDACYDPEFVTISNIISSTRCSTNRFGRISAGNKYKIETTNVTSAEHQRGDHGEDITYLDSIIGHLHEKDIAHDIIVGLVTYLKTEQYDTESMDLDLRWNGNISHHMIDHQQCIDAMNIVFDRSRASTEIFNLGYRFNYGGHYKEEDYAIRDWGAVIYPKYKDLKEEILHYKCISLKQVKGEIVPKAKAYRGTKLARSSRPGNTWLELWGKEHDMKYGISLDRLMCIILYTDYTDLSGHFTSTFRNNGSFEPLQTIIKRHRNYYWMGSLLQETVGGYGQTASGTYGGFKGPFFCGMSMIMKMPEFNMHISLPTSTSCHIEVALKFSGKSEIIIEFNNNHGDAQFIYGLDVSWISRFKEEDERLFFGRAGIHPLNITSIRIIESSLNLEEPMSAITALNSILSNAYIKETEISGDDQYGVIMGEIFNYNTSKKEMIFNEYVYGTFHCFANHKTQILLSLFDLDKYVHDKRLIDLLCYDLVKQVIYCDVPLKDQISCWIDNTDNKQNVIKPHLFQIFKNITYLFIGATDHPFSLLSLLKVIKNTPINAIKISTDEEIWPFIKVSSMYHLIEEEYRIEGFEIEIHPDAAIMFKENNCWGYKGIVELDVDDNK